MVFSASNKDLSLYVLTFINLNSTEFTVIPTLINSSLSFQNLTKYILPKRVLNLLV
jgi:hypothetical protein